MHPDSLNHWLNEPADEAICRRIDELMDILSPIESAGEMKLSNADACCIRDRLENALQREWTRFIEVAAEVED